MTIRKDLEEMVDIWNLRIYEECLTEETMDYLPFIKMDIIDSVSDSYIIRCFGVNVWDTDIDGFNDMDNELQVRVDKIFKMIGNCGSCCN